MYTCVCVCVCGKWETDRFSLSLFLFFSLSFLSSLFHSLHFSFLSFSSYFLYIQFRPLSHPFCLFKYWCIERCTGTSDWLMLISRLFEAGNGDLSSYRESGNVVYQRQVLFIYLMFYTWLKLAEKKLPGLQAWSNGHVSNWWISRGFWYLTLPLRSATPLHFSSQM